MTVRNIVFVDDDHEDSEFFSTALRQLDPEINVSVAFNADEMYQCLDNQVPDLLFLDSFLQEQSGHDYIEAIRKRPGCQHLAVVMYTGAAAINLVSTAFNAGANAYLVKPHSLPEIKKMMVTLLQLLQDGQLSTLKGMYYLDGKFHDSNTTKAF